MTTEVRTSQQIQKGRSTNLQRELQTTFIKKSKQQTADCFSSSCFVFKHSPTMNEQGYQTSFPSVDGGNQQQETRYDDLIKEVEQNGSNETLVVDELPGEAIHDQLPSVEEAKANLAVQPATKKWKKILIIACVVFVIAAIIGSICLVWVLQKITCLIVTFVMSVKCKCW